MKKLVMTCMLVLLVGMAQATVLTFDAGVADYALMPQNYGDNVTATNSGGYSYGENGEGFTPNVTVEYIGDPGGLHYWGSGFSGTTGVLNNEDADENFTTAKFTAATGHQVVLHSLLWSSYSGHNFTVDSITVTDQDSTVLYNSGSFLTGGSHATINLGAITGQTLTVTADLTTSGSDNDSFGFDDITFSEYEFPTTPMITVQPESVYTDEGDLAIFSVAATSSSGTLSYAWTKDSVALADNEFIAGSAHSRLVISPAALADVGNYQVIVTDAQGSSPSSIAALTLNLPLPVITVQPANLTQSAGTAAFSATATDAANYQWYYGENPISENGTFSGTTTASLQINGANQLNNGIYSVRVSNARGTVASKLARLTITTSTSIGDAIDNNTVLLSNPGAWYSQTTYTADGTDAARSAGITHGQQSALTAAVIGPGEVTFQRYANSEGADRLNAYLNGSSFDAVSGTSTPWGPAATFIPDNAHELKWQYSKDGSINTGLDAGFIDQFTFTPYDLSSVESAVDLPPEALTLGGAALWYGQDNTSSDGTDAARSPSIGDGEKAWFETTVMGPGRVIFLSKTSCEGADRLYLRVDGTSVHSQSGISDWTAVTNWINWGEHTLRWSYEKDGSVASADDAVWVDQINYTPVTRSSLATATDQTGMTWTTSETNPWFGQSRFSNDGVDAAQSGVTPDGGKSWIKAVAEGPGQLSFRWKTTCEGADRLRFYINDVYQNQKSGLNDWTTYNVDLSATSGTTEFKWSYDKDGSVASYEDAVWIDQVVFAGEHDPVGLTVASAHGSPSPAVGGHSYDWNTEVSCSVAHVDAGTTQYECIGWAGSGSIPASGSGNLVVAILDTDSSITWNWATNYLLDVNISGNGSVDADDAFYVAGSEQTLTATPDAGWLFMGWSGDASGTNEAFVMMTEPKTVMATFSDDADNDGLTNTEEAGYGSNPWKSDTDGDGFDDAFEVAQGLPPTVNNSALTDYIENNGSTFGLYTSNAVLDVAVGQMVVETADGMATLSLQLEKSQNLVTWTNAGEAVEWNLSVDDDELFFRVRSGK